MGSEIITTTQHLVIFIALIVSAMYLISLSGRVRSFVYKQSYLKKEKLVMILFFGFIGVLASEYGFKLIGVIVNVRDCIALFAGILGGPAVGIGAGLISGFYRMSGLVWSGWTGTLGCWSAIGCGLATMGAGFLGAWLSKYKNINIRKITPKEIWIVAGIVAIWEVIHLQVIVPSTALLYAVKMCPAVVAKTFGPLATLTAEKLFFGIEKLFFMKLLFPMVVANVLGILLFLFITRDAVVKREMEVAEREIIEAELKVKEKGEKF